MGPVNRRIEMPVSAAKVTQDTRLTKTAMAAQRVALVVQIVRLG
jgi:hypothetical protein